jgi:alpha-aminoadipic semialdehyde synthase
MLRLSVHPWTNTLRSADSAGVLLLNEIGLDPGIDHCSAHSLLSSLRSKNKHVVSFTSFCGGLPAPEAAEGVPLGYKFSWSPRGVLRAASESASFRLAGQVRLSPNRLSTAN